ncbi:MAG: phytanoyl-CoA dioxygenase family protein [Chloroflexi bacterium]|nr:phytanoyl-CoA dioxygenase family protein [Chloroflexota bacterium]
MTATSTPGTTGTTEATATTAPQEQTAAAAPAVQLQFDTREIDECPPDLYRHEAIARGIDSFDNFGEEAVEFFQEYGYVVVHHAFSPGEVQQALDGLLYLIAGNRPDFRGIQFEAKARKILDTIPPEQRQDVVRKLIGYVEFDERLKAMSRHPRLIDAVSRLIGEPPALWADQALLKPPLIGREKPWHQDHAYFNLPIGTRIVGAWIALDEATPENGCMHIIPGSHRDGPVVHFKRRDWQICDEHVAVGKIAAVPLEPGGVLLFDGLLHHGTPPTQSERRRRALQFHYYPASVARITGEERLKVFGSEGKDVTC